MDQKDERDRPRPTIRDVARVARVSTATVSNVLTGRRSVTADLAARVQAAVQSLGYKADVVASNLRRQQTQVIGLVVPDFRNPFFGELVASVEGRAGKAGYRLIVASSNESPEVEREQVDALLAWRVAGLLVVPTDDRFPSRPVLRRAGVPTVVVDRCIEDPELDSVGVENAGAAAKALRHLAGLGHRRILVVASMTSIDNIRQRIAGVEEAAEEAGIADGIQIVETGIHVDGATESVARILEERDPPTAIFGLNNVAALGALRALARFRISVPDEMSVASFDDYDWMEVLHPAITAVRQPVNCIADAAFDLLMKRLGETVRPKSSVCLPCTLVVRESTASPRTALLRPSARPGRRIEHQPREERA